MNLWGVFPWGQPPPFSSDRSDCANVIPNSFFYDQHGGAAHGPPLRPPMNFDRLVLDSTSLCVPGVPLEARDSLQRQSIHAACVGGHLDIVRWLHEEKGVSIELMGEAEFRALVGPDRT